MGMRPDLFEVPVFRVRPEEETARLSFTFDWHRAGVAEWRGSPYCWAQGGALPSETQADLPVEPPIHARVLRNQEHDGWDLDIFVETSGGPTPKLALLHRSEHGSAEHAKHAADEAYRVARKLRSR